ncbi:MAG: hypothetical protein Q9218_003557 [Villophora microphyllina]
MASDPQSKEQAHKMAKRKTFDDSANEDTDESVSLEESPSEDEDDYEEVRQEFEFFDPQEPWDFEGLTRLVRQLLDSDASSFHLGAIADLVLGQPLLGEQDKPVIKQLVNYVGDRAATNPTLSPLRALLDPASGNEVGLILTERLINIATELVPPMYEMLLEEVSWAVDDKEPYTFTHYLIMSRIYLAVPSTLNEKTNRPKKKQKPKAQKGINEGHSMYYFHPEDEVLQRHANLYGGFDYVKQASEGEFDAKSTFHDFGIKTRGHLILIEAARFEAAVKDLKAEFKETSAAADDAMAET